MHKTIVKKLFARVVCNLIKYIIVHKGGSWFL